MATRRMRLTSVRTLHSVALKGPKAGLAAVDHLLAAQLLAFVSYAVATPRLRQTHRGHIVASSLTCQQKHGGLLAQAMTTRGRAPMMGCAQPFLPSDGVSASVCRP